MSYWNLFTELPKPLLIPILLVYGLIIGSYLNVCIYRIPKGISTIHPPSHCPQSGTRLPWYDNIPVLSYLLLRGRSRFTGKTISIQYPLIEAATALLFTSFFLLHVPSLLPIQILLGLYFIAVLLVIAGIDWHTCEVPFRLTLIPFALLLLTALLFPSSQLLRPPDYFEALWLQPNLTLNPETFNTLKTLGAPLWFDALQRVLLNASISAGLVFWFIMFADAIFRADTMGFGDVQVIGLIGAFFGPLIAAIAFFGGAIIALLFACTPFRPRPKIAKEDTDSGAPSEKAIPFCPFMCIAALLALLLLPFIN